jgi:hypothetical protein
MLNFFFRVGGPGPSLLCKLYQDQFGLPLSCFNITDQHIQSSDMLTLWCIFKELNITFHATGKTKISQGQHDMPV